LAIASIARAERLPVRAFTTFDGLANDVVNRIVRDSRGFLWFCTGEGLSRFDGFGFKNYAQNEGLPHRNVNDFFETKSGDFLVATNSGLAVFNPHGKAYRWNILKSNLEQNSTEPPLFSTFIPPDAGSDRKTRAILSLAADRDGRIYAGTGGGLFRVEKNDDEWSFEKIESGEWTDQTEFAAMTFDAAGYLWLVTSTGIYRLSPNGAIENFHEDGGYSILADKGGQIWVGSSGTNAGLRVFSISDDGKDAQLTKIYHKSDGLPEERPIPAITQTSDGRIFVLAGKYLCEFLPQANQSKFRILQDGAFQSLAEDAGGNLWLGTIQEGSWKLALRGFTKYDGRDGLPTEHISSLGIDAAGNVFVTDGVRKISRLTDGKFETVEPLGLTNRSWGNNLLDFQNADGEWWIPSGKGLLRYPNIDNFSDLAKTTPKKIYTMADGMLGDEIFNLFEDSRGDVWITSASQTTTLQLWERKTGIIHQFSIDDGLPESNGAVSFSEDEAGNVWLGFYYGGLARYRNGKFELFNAKNGIPESSVNAVLSDKAGRLWIATASRGVFRADNPTAEAPNFLSLSTNGGLSSNQANCLAEDNFGHIYIGTGRGIDRLDPPTGYIKSFTQTDGLPGSIVQFCRSDPSGTLWFVSRNSLVKFVPQIESALKPPPVFIGGINVNGSDRPISELGADRIENLELNADEHQIRIDFFALGFNSGDRLRYQYKLNDEDWHEPEDAKSLNFNLVSGNYHFFVRAVNADNIASEKPAMVSFNIAYPFWQRWGFMTLAVIFVCGTILSIERARAARLLALKNAFGNLSISENRFRQMNEQSPLGIIVFAPDGSIRAVNRAYEDFWGIRFEQIKDWDFFADEQLIRIGVVEKMRRVFNGETVHFPPEPYDPRDNNHGIEFDEKTALPWFESFAYPVTNDEGKLLEVILVMEDVTDTKRADEIEQKAKTERLRELEKVRRRIAADLHDDIGSSLTQISIFSEVLQQRIDKTNTQVLEPLEFIAGSSRELVDAMSDIVWAINPQKDFLSELSGKMRRFAADVFTARNIEFTFDAPHFAEEFALGANLRREVFLIFKESVNNIVKHAECTSVSIKLSVEKTEILLSLRDNGAGFETGDTNDGHGLVSMKQRAAGLDGTLEIISGKTAGTIVTLIAPLGANTNEKLL
jgi:PAS domain S-box-containing protein